MALLVEHDQVFDFISSSQFLGFHMMDLHLAVTINELVANQTKRCSALLSLQCSKLHKNSPVSTVALVPSQGLYSYMPPLFVAAWNQHFHELLPMEYFASQAWR
jgi:hypothetical protein